jgi:hypothetical protein
MGSGSRSRWVQQLGGLIVALISAGFVIWTWYTAFFEGYYYRKTSMIFPAMLVLGLGLIVFRGYKEERIARGENISGKQGLGLITARWWAILVLALFAGLGNYFLVNYL